MASKDAGDLMKEKLVERLQDIPGVASVSLNLEDFESGIKVKLDEDADEAEVLEAVRALLVAYGVRSLEDPTLEIGNRLSQARAALGVDVRISEVKGGARVEVIGTAVRSFRLVPSTPMAIAQGVSDAWCQVLGRIPPEITRVALSDEGGLTVTATDGSQERIGHADIEEGWTMALPLAVGRAIGVLEPVSEAGEPSLAHTDW
ncbi:MAG TPA: hypothetical protein VFU96_07830 [Acidimicrobiia bacterium]|nr:hypothetical protein [Acidimicrobiia bacterium]